MLDHLKMGVRILALSFSVLASIPASQSEPQVLDEAAWREDLTHLVNEIKTVHPNPFRNASIEDFDQRVQILNDDLSRLTDKAIILRMVELVSMIDDGHTRLSIPRHHNELALFLGHSGPDEDVIDDFKFSSLPFRFSLFDEGLHIVSAQKGYERHLGARVDAIDDVSIDEALSAVRSLIYAENPLGETLMSPDRLAMPEVLKYSGVSKSREKVSLTLTRDHQQYELITHPLSKGVKIDLAQLANTTRLFADSHPNEIKWFKLISGGDAMFVQFDELDPYSDYLVSDFMSDALSTAKRSNATRVILDLRKNRGGSASVNPSIVSALVQSEFNEYGRLYVLTGRETMSAASMLVSELEQYTHAIFVGEPASARPSTFGDPRKTTLPNSGLTLRVSTIYWQSWLAGDFREFVTPHLDAPPLFKDSLAGRDSALEVALTYQPPSDVVPQMAELFDKEKLQAGLLRFVSWVNSPLEETHDALEDLLAYGHRYLDQGALRKGRFMMVMARDYYPASDRARAGLGRAHELNGDNEIAIRRYREALELNPGNDLAKQALDRLVAK